MNDLSQLETIFFAALKKTMPEERTAFLDDVCGNDRQLRQRVEAMLIAHLRAGNFLESPPASLASPPLVDSPPLEPPGTVIGPYKLVEVIAEGGMGVVYLAQQSEPIARRVALKIIKPGLDTRQVIGRFDSERRALAIIDHPNVAKVLDAGVTHSGRPYFVMEFIDGAPITQFCDDRRLDLRERLELLLPVCQAVQHAHLKGIIHRDLKPSNVMVAMYDDRPVPKVIDFGVAKAIGSALTDESLVTQFGQVVGTLEYMSPEQSSFNQLDVDLRSDIYSLGVLLYELVTGTTPLRRARREAMALDEILRAIRDEDPPTPSKQLSSGDTRPEVAAQRRTETVRLTRLVRGELDWIVMKALDKDRTRRYESASALAADMERFLRGDAVQACPPSLTYRARKFARRYRVGVSAALLAATALIGGAGLALWQADQARDARDAAEAAQASAEHAQRQLAERYRIAQESVDTYLLRVTQDERLDHPAFRQLRQQLLEAALPYYDQLHQLVPTDDVSRAARAEALQQLGRVRHELGQFDASRAALEEAAQLFDQLSTAHPLDVAYRRSLADVLVHLADHYRTRGATGDMRDYELQALELREQLAAAQPDADVPQLALAQSFTNVGIATPRDAGQALLEQALQIWQALADRSPDTPLYREYLSLGYQNLARRFAWDRAEQALPFQQQAAELCAQLAREQPDAKRAQIRWAQSQQDLADTLEILSGRLDEARAHREESLRILRDYLAKHPQWPDVRAHQARMQDLLAHTLQEQGELEMAQASARTAIGLWEQLVSEFPDVVEYEGGLASAQRTLGAVQVAQGQAAAGLELLTQARDRLQQTLERIGPHDPSDELLRSVQQALADTRRLLGQDRSAMLDDELHESQRHERRQAAGEALRPSKFLAGLSSLQTHGLRAGGEAPILPQTAVQEQTMKRQTSFLPSIKKRNGRRSQRKPSVERLENRALLTLVSYWTGDNTAEDAVGANHGSLVSGATYATGQVNQAFSFDGVNDRVQVADSPSLALTQSMTIEGWVKAISMPVQQGEIFFRGDDRGGLDPYALCVKPDGTLRFAVSSLTASWEVAAPMPLGQFVHVAATLEDATGAMKLYLNGVLMTQAITTVRPFADLDPNSNPGIGIGNYGGYPATPNNFPFHGLIDELKVYDHALSAADVLTSFNATKGSLQPSISIGDVIVAEGDSTFKFLGSLANPTTPDRMIYGPDGNLYVSTLMGSSVLRYDAQSGAPLPAPGKTGAEFVSPSAGGLNVARELGFGPDGNLYVVSSFSDAVLRFNAQTGDPMGEFIPAGSGGLDQPRGLLFHTDGRLYVTSVGETGGHDAVLRYDATTGAPAGISGIPGDAVFISPGLGGLDNPAHIAFHNGLFYVASTANTPSSNSILRYNADGSFKDAFVPSGSGGLVSPGHFVFHESYLYVVAWSTNKVLRYDGTTGAFDSTVVSGDGLVTPLCVLFEPNGDFLVTSRDTNELRRYGDGSYAVLTVSLNGPFPTPVSVDYATASGTAAAGNDFTATQGTITFTPGVAFKTIVVPVIDDAVTEPTETFTFNLSNPVGGTIVDGQATVSILDNDPFTKFYVVNDASTDRTYEYQSSGAAVENYALGSGNTAPRGAASTAAGTSVWVVDANKKVYVYNTSGALVGSWTAGGLQSNASLQGIATDGTDIWLVDSQTDKVYRYTGAAALTSGSQNAAGSFSLNSSNTNPKDIVTDGSYLWTVNDSSSDYVFKYTVAGTYVGKWKISTSGAKAPTGITLDPSSPAHIWIVDSGTDRVYQYDNAVSLTSGSKSASGNFALASGNTNPQGIADPPPAGALPAGALPLADSREVTTTARAAAVDLALLQGLGVSRADTIDTPWARTATRPASSPPRRRTAEEMPPILPGAPGGLPRHTRQFEEVRRPHGSVRATDVPLADWDSDVLQNVFLP